MGIAKYFETCKQYWLNNGCNEKEANRRALWWDCKEVWDFDNSWNDEKRNFFEAMKRNITGDKEGEYYEQERKN